MIKIQRKNRYSSVLFKDCIEDKQNKAVLSYLKDYLANIEEKISICENAVICGELGVGKTMMTRALQNELRKIEVEEEIQTGNFDPYTQTYVKRQNIRKMTVQYISCANLIKALREHFSKDKEENKLYHDCDLLIVDEVGVQYGTTNERLTLNDLFNERYENYKPVILVSNKELFKDKIPDDTDITDIMGWRIIDRINSGSSKYFYINGKSKRK